jgi:hypothetical protein
MEYKPIGKISLPEERCYYGTEGYNGPSIYVDKINLFTGFLWYVPLSEQSLKDERLINIYDERCVTSISNFSRYTWIQWKKTD